MLSGPIGVADLDDDREPWELSSSWKSRDRLILFELGTANIFDPVLLEAKFIMLEESTRFFQSSDCSRTLPGDTLSDLGKLQKEFHPQRRSGPTLQKFRRDSASPQMSLQSAPSKHITSFPASGLIYPSESDLASFAFRSISYQNGSVLKLTHPPQVSRQCPAQSHDVQRGSHDLDFRQLGICGPDIGF